jgi:hypothetical protein
LICHSQVDEHNQDTNQQSAVRALCPAALSAHFLSGVAALQARIKRERKIIPNLVFGGPWF